MFTALYLSAAVLRKARQMMLLSRMAMIVNCISNHSHPCSCALRYTMSACSCIEPNTVFLHGLRHSQHYFHRHNRDRAAASATATVAALALATLGHPHRPFPHIALPRERGMWDSRLGLHLCAGWKSSNAFRCQRSLLLLCWTATASLACALLVCFTNNRDTSSATRCQREASSWGECDAESLMLGYRSRIRDLGCRFTSTRHMHIESKPSTASLSRLHSMHGWLAGVPFSL